MKVVLFLLTALVLLAGCGAPQIKTLKTEPAPLIKKFASKASTDKTTAKKNILTLSDALHWALQRNPQLQAFSLEIRAREAATLQAALLPNPELEVEVENFAGSGPLATFKATETTVSIGQLIELAGKRQKRTKLAQLFSEQANWDFENQKRIVYSQVVQAFYQTLIAQEMARLNQEIFTLTKDFRKQVAYRVKIGRSSPAELARADVEMAQAKIAFEQSKRKLQAARRQLAATWGANEDSFESVQGSVEALKSLPSLSVLQKALENNPLLSKQKLKKEQSQLRWQLAKAYRVPDPVIRLGYRRINEIDQQALVAGLSLPLPILNQNQGAIEEAAWAVKKTNSELKALQLQLTTELNTLYQHLLATHQAIQALKNEILPQAQKAFETITKGYQLGKFTFLQVLDAQRSLFSARQSYFQQLAAFQNLRAQIERLTGQSLSKTE